MIADSSVESKFGRLPGVDTMAMGDMNSKPTEQFDIPPKEEVVKAEPKTPKKPGKLYHPDMNEDEKKKALRDHLANARKKGAEVRKQRAAERKAQQKAEKEAKKAPKVQMEVQEVEEEEVEEDLEPRKPVIMQKEQPKTIRKRAKKETEFVSQPPQEGYGSPQVDYERLAELVAGKLKPAQAPAPVLSTPQITQEQFYQQNYLPMQNQMQQYEKIIREQERTKVTQEHAKRAEEEKQRKAQEALHQANKHYFRGMPKQAFNTSEDPWSNLFLPKTMR